MHTIENERQMHTIENERQMFALRLLLLLWAIWCAGRATGHAAGVREARAYIEGLVAGPSST